MSIEVKNLKGTGKYKAYNKGYTSWKDYWIANNNTGNKWFLCAVDGCNKTASDGAHVKKVGSVDNSWYILPMCHSHNMKEDEIFDVDESYLVPVVNP